MITQMNKTIFSQNLQDTVEEIISLQKMNPRKYRFRINPVVEPGKSMLASDDIMRLSVIPPDRVAGKTFTIDDVVSMLTLFSPLVPIWIDVKLNQYTDEEAEFQLNCSLRLRKPSLLRNQESGHPPFRAVLPPGENCPQT